MRKIDGFLFIGDPHISSKKPGRRKDVDFSSVIIDKLDQAIKIANDKNYLPVILGDLFNRPKEDSESVKARTIRCLSQSKHKAVCLVGNHDITHAKLSDDDSLNLLGDSGVIDLIETSGRFDVFNVGDSFIGLGGTPYGQDIPNSVEDLFPENLKTVIWITHHDIAFEGSYPGSKDAHEINGCKLVVNGHMHLTKKTLKVGDTTWFNPGNITRQALDAIQHIPRVWEFSSDGKLKPIELNYEKDVFDLTGRLVDIQEPEKENLDSVFVRLMEVETSSEMKKTDDGSVIFENIQEKFERENTDAKIKNIIINLLSEVTENT